MCIIITVVIIKMNPEFIVLNKRLINHPYFIDPLTTEKIMDMQKLENYKYILCRRNKCRFGSTTKDNS